VGWVWPRLKVCIDNERITALHSSKPDFIYIHLFQKRLVKVLFHLASLLHVAYQARNALWAKCMESAKGHNNMDSGNFPKLYLRNMERHIFFCMCMLTLFTYDPQYISGLVCKMQDARCNKTGTNLF